MTTARTTNQKFDEPKTSKLKPILSIIVVICSIAGNSLFTKLPMASLDLSSRLPSNSTSSSSNYPQSKTSPSSSMSCSQHSTMLHYI